MNCGTRDKCLFNAVLFLESGTLLSMFICSDCPRQRQSSTPRKLFWTKLSAQM
jgi:hypothetical protein